VTAVLRASQVVLAAVVLACLCLAGGALALTPPQITVQASATQVEVGEPFTIQLKAMVEQGDPQPGHGEINPPRDFNVVGQTESSQTLMQMGSGGTTVQVGRVIAWQLVGQRAGRFTIPAPTVEWNGRRVAGTSVAIEVVPATGQKRRQQPSNNPFLMPGGLPFPLPGYPPDDDDASEPRVTPELAMPSAPDPQFFVRAIVDKKSAVVGQQITASVYIYAHVHRLQTVGDHDAPLADFLRIPLAKNPGTDPQVYAMVGGTRYIAKRIDQMAIFPLRAGDLHTGAWRYDFISGGSRTPIPRASEDLVIHVTEPPRAGRPVGYALGDVGQLTLSASVAPRRIDQGGEVSVSLRLAGTGNLPQSLRVPERTGVEWLDPEKKESIEPQAGVVGGWRQFGYVVRVKESGKVDLGEVTLPFWDPAAGQYRVARASLGTIDVNPTMPAVDPVTKKPLDLPAPDPFVTLPSARATLGAYTPPRARLLDGRSMWFAIAVPPFLVGLFSAGARAARRARTRRATAKDSPATLAQGALADAHKAEASGDAQALAAALTRAVHFAVEGATGLKSRGALVADLPGELADHGLSRELGEEISATLAACEVVRFDPSPDASTTRDLAARVRAVVADLGRRKAA
jgi:BatD DUF11 like domain